MRKEEYEPEYFREYYETEEILYIYRSTFKHILPFVASAYKYGDEKYNLYGMYAEKLLTDLFGSENNLKKDYMKCVGEYILITSPNMFVEDYNLAVFKLQEFCRKNHITFRAIGEPDSRIFRFADLHERLLREHEKAETEYKIWKEMSEYARGLVIRPEHILIDSLSCHCSYDSDDGYYYWSMNAHFVGKAGKYRVAACVDFSNMHDLFVRNQFPKELPKVRVRFYLTMLENRYANPWANVKETVGIPEIQISKESKELVRRRIIGCISDFDRKHRKEMWTNLGEETPSWHDNYFRRVNEDFNAEADITVNFEDGMIYKSYSDLLPAEQLEKCKNLINELDEFM